MNTFFWPRRRESSKGLITRVDTLLQRLCPESEIALLDERIEPPPPSTSGVSSISVTSDTEIPWEINQMSNLNQQLFDDNQNNGNSSGDEHPINGNCSDAGSHSSINCDDEDEIVAELETLWSKIRAVFHNLNDDASDRDRKMNRMAQLLLRYNILPKILQPNVFSIVTFDTRKYIASVFRALTVHNFHGFINHIARDPYLVKALMESYHNNDTALVSGSMLRDCFEHEALAKLFLYDMPNEFAEFFEIAKVNTNFDISADALVNITRLLLVHKQMAFQVLKTNFERIFNLLNGLLKDSNYATKRQALQLLSELLLDPVNFTVMQKYIASKHHLKQIMLLLREPSAALRMDAFHVFKIFVANPNKSEEVELLLLRNCEKLLAFVMDFELDVQGGIEFQQEKSLLIFTLKRMCEIAATQQGFEPKSTDSDHHNVGNKLGGPPHLSASSKLQC